MNEKKTPWSTEAEDKKTNIFLAYKTNPTKFLNFQYR